MKKIFLLSIFFIFLAILFPTISSAQLTTVSCGGSVVNTFTGDPLDNVNVYIYVAGELRSVDPCLDCGADPDWQTGAPVAITDSSGNWSYSCTCWPSSYWGEIERIEFQRTDYLDEPWYNTSGDYFLCETGVVEMTPTGLDAWGCVDVYSDEGKCQIVPDDGTYKTWGNEASCIAECNRYKCTLAYSCDICNPWESEEDCPSVYIADPTCNNECQLEPTDPPRPSPRMMCTGSGGQGVDTAIGCIPIEDSNAIAGWLLAWGLGIAGGIALLLVIVAGFQITTSSGDPKRLQAGRELLTSALTGLILLILSALILRIIGIELFNIPGFGSI